MCECAAAIRTARIPASSLLRVIPLVLVAADQLDQARAIAALPIPPEIIEKSETEKPDFEPPICPKHGAGDSVL
jgi:hypothetical protein